jgi:glycosyltransferase involved in cell wall biosynthesis
MLTRRCGGVSHATLAVLKALARRGRLDLHVVTCELDDGELPPETRVTRIRPPVQRRVAWRFGRALLARDYAQALSEAALPPADVVYTRWMEAGLGFSRLHPNVPLICHSGHVLAHREAIEDSSLPQFWRALDSRIAERMERSCYARENWTHVVSTRLVREARAAYFRLNRQMFLTQPLCVDTDRFAAAGSRDAVRAQIGASADTFVIVTVARMVRWKNLDWLVRAIEHLPGDTRLVLVGDGPDRAALEAAVRPRVRDRVHFAGHVAPGPWLAAGDAFALPSTIESFGVAYAEAMLTGLPCVGLRYAPPSVLSSAGEVIRDGDGGLLVSDEQEFVRALELLAGDRVLRLAMGQRAKSIAARRYTGDSYAAFLEQLVSDVLGLEPQVSLDEALSVP